MMTKTKTRPERCRGSLLLQTRLENRWVRLIFRTLVLCTAAMLLMSLLARGVQRFRSETLRRLEEESAAVRTSYLQAVQTGALYDQLTCAEQLLALSEQQTAFGGGNPAFWQTQVSALSTAVEESYHQAETLYLSGERAAASAAFQAVDGYRDAALWQRLCRTTLRLEERRLLQNGQPLTAALLRLRAEEKNLPLSFAPLSGDWLCREDCLRLLAGEGERVRCLRASGNLLCGGETDALSAVPDRFTILCQGGLTLSPDGETLQLYASAGEPAPSFTITVLSENILRVTGDAAWSGVYYRVVG